MMGVGISGLNRLSSVQLRTQTNRLAAAVRHAYNRAIAEGLYVRMALYIDADRYSVEASSTPVFIDRDRQETSEEEAKGQPPLPDVEGTPPPPPKFAPVIPDITMQRGIGIDGVLTSGQADVFESGVAYIHFFPNGFVEPALIYTTDGDGEYYTLMINPLTGKVRREAGKVDPDIL